MFKRFLFITLVFFIGFISSNVIPIDLPFSNVSEEKNSPYDWIEVNEIHTYDDRVVLDIDNAVLVAIADTNSMDPVLDEYSNAIQIYPKSTGDIHVGDIVSYRSSYATSNIIHRVVDISEDEEGWYAVMKGDNLNETDPEKVRFEQIRRVVVAVVY